MVENNSDVLDQSQKIDFNAPKDSFQAQLNLAYPLERRELLIAGADRDIHGRPVMYFRNMDRVYLRALIEQGAISGTTYFEGRQPGWPYNRLDENVKAGELINILTGNAEFVGLNEDSIEEARDRYNRKEMSLREIAKLLNPKLEEADLELIEKGLTFRVALPMMERIIDTDYLLSKHTGSALQKFSRRLSLHVGGVPRETINTSFTGSDRVCIEFVIPHVYVLPHPSTITAEKEVSVASLSKNWITRVFNDDNQLNQEVVRNRLFPIGQHEPTSMMDTCGGFAPEWAGTDNVIECLPIQLIERYQKSMERVFHYRPELTTVTNS